MPKGPLRSQFFNDFTGGLNNNDQRQNLALNETPDCSDVVFNARGGFSTRRGYRTLVSSGALNGANIGGQFSAGTEVLWGINNAGALFTWDGATYTDVVTASPADVTRNVRGVNWRNKLYFANWLNGGTLLQRTWNGTAFATLTNTANNNYTTPTGGNAPKARLIANFQGHMWWADTLEGATRHRSRVRYSHPLQPEDFADADYFDLDPDDETNEITALVPFGNMLMVFKKRGIWSIFGADRESFVAEPISTVAGAWQQEGTTTNAALAMWWSPDGNVYSYDGREVKPIGERIVNVVYDGTVTPGGDHRICWADNRLWLSLVPNGSYTFPETYLIDEFGDYVVDENGNYVVSDEVSTVTDPRILYMFDPAVGRLGAWTQFSTQMTSMYWWRKNTGASGLVFTMTDKARLYDFGNPSQEVDDDGGTLLPVLAYYVTAWFSAQDTALLKRWRRPNITAACGDTAVLNVSVYFDFNESTRIKLLTMNLTSASGSMLWGNNWGSLWGGSDPVYVFDRLAGVGRSHAVKFKFQVEGHASRWWIDSYALPYYQKGYR